MSLLLAVTNNFAFKDILSTKSQDRLDNDTIKSSNVSSKNTKVNHNLFIVSLYPILRQLKNAWHKIM